MAPNENGLEKSLMCLTGDYWHKKEPVNYADRQCGTYTHEEKLEAYKAVYANHIKGGVWTFDQFLAWFPAASVPMTPEEVLSYAESIR